MIDDSFEDIRKKFKGTFCFLSLNGKEFLVQYTGDDDEGRFTLTSPDYGDIVVDRETLNNCLRFSFPRNGLYNVEETVIEFNRVPERQWKRAPCGDNSRLYPILEKIGVRINSSLSINLHNLEEIYAKKYPKSLDAALKEMKYCKALNRNFAISPSLTGKDSKVLLWYRSQPVGFADTSSKEVTVHYNPLYQEVSDFLRKSEPTWNLLPKLKQ